MWKSLIRAGVVGGVIVFIWLMISWMVLPFHNMTMQTFKDEGDVIDCVLDEAPKDGVYFVPKTTETMQKHPQVGLFVTVKRTAKMDHMLGSMVCSLITQMIGAFLISYLLFQTKMLKYWQRVGFVTVAGLTVGVLGVIPGWTWFGFSGGYAFVEIFDYVIGWFFGGLGIAKLVKR